MPRVRTVALAAVVAGLVLALLVVYAAGPWKDGYRVPEGGARAGDRALAASQSVLTPASGDPAGAMPTEAGLREALQALLTVPQLGGRAGAAVVDVATGRQLYAADGDSPLVPASANKIPTAVAALAALGPDHRLTTRVVRSGPGAVVLVGGGDPTLTNVTGSSYDTVYGAARLETLAKDTAAALKAAGVTQVQLTYDTSLYPATETHPIGAGNGNIALVSALMVDEARQNPLSTSDSPRVANPAQDAAAKFAAALGREGVSVTGTPASGAAPAGAQQIAAVQSPPLAAMVERMLTESDNDMAEALQRQVAIARNQPATFAGGSAAVRQTLEGLGLRMNGVVFADGSGLNRANQIPASVLTQVIALAASPAHPELRTAITGLPVAGFTGTLSDRFDERVSASAAGVLRAKTGTLTKVSALAGVVVDRDGRALAFAFLTDQVPADPAANDAAKTALDKAAATLAGCGCGTPGTPGTPVTR